MTEKGTIEAQHVTPWRVSDVVPFEWWVGSTWHVPTLPAIKKPACVHTMHNEPSVFREIGLWMSASYQFMCATGRCSLELYASILYVTCATLATRTVWFQALRQCHPIHRPHSYRPYTRIAARPW